VVPDVFLTAVVVYDLEIPGPWPAILPVVISFAVCLGGSAAGRGRRPRGNRGESIQVRRVKARS
jgi:hypothetical protein